MAAGTADSSWQLDVQRQDKLLTIYARLPIDVAGGSSSVAKRLDDKRQAWLPGVRVDVWNDEYAACLLAYLEAWYGQEIRWIDQPLWPRRRERARRGVPAAK
jgi:hypothetical protein